MTCKDLIDFLMDYLEEELPADAKRHFEEHLGGCHECTAYVDSYRETVRLGKMICQPDDRLPTDTPEDLVSAILEARRAGT